MKLAEQVLAMYTSVFSQHVIKKKNWGFRIYNSGTLSETVELPCHCHPIIILDDTISVCIIKNVDMIRFKLTVSTYPWFAEIYKGWYILEKLPVYHMAYQYLIKIYSINDNNKPFWQNKYFEIKHNPECFLCLYLTRVYAQLRQLKMLPYINVKLLHKEI